MSIGQRIKENREKKGWSQAKLAKACGWGRGTRISNYEADVREPGLAEIKIISDALGFPSPVELVQDELNIKIGDKGVPLFSWDDINGTPVTRLVSPVDISNSAYALKVDDSSMTTALDEPSFPSGTIIIVEPAREAQVGKYVIIKHNSGKILFRKYVDSGIYRKFIALNQAADSCLVEEAKILGLVVASMNLDL